VPHIALGELTACRQTYYMHIREGATSMGRKGKEQGWEELGEEKGKEVIRAGRGRIEMERRESYRSGKERKG